MNARGERLGHWLTLAAAAVLVVTTVAILGMIALKGLATFFIDQANPIQFLFSLQWDPGRSPMQGGPAIGAWMFTAGSLAVTCLAILLSTPLSLAAAAFMVELAPKFGQRVLQPAIEVFVGIPSVVYGWIGLTVLVPRVRALFGGQGFSLLAGGVVLAIMIMPTIVTVTADSLRSLSRDLREASYGLGATRWQTIAWVLIPAAMPGILTGVVLGMARAFGEALAVQMVIGNMRTMPKGLLQPATTMTSVLTMDMGNTVLGSVWNNALWSIALLLLVITFLFVVLIRWIGRRGVAS